jgi:hypothetical protein
VEILSPNDPALLDAPLKLTCTLTVDILRLESDINFIKTHTRVDVNRNFPFLPFLVVIKTTPLEALYPNAAARAPLSTLQIRYHSG